MANRALLDPHTRRPAPRQRWGTSVTIDAHGCNTAAIASRRAVRRFLRAVTDEIGMKRYRRAIVFKFGAGSLHGLSAIQFIYTSDITFHSGGRGAPDQCYVDVFTCGVMDAAMADKAAKVLTAHFGGTATVRSITERGRFE